MYLQTPRVTPACHHQSTSEQFAFPQRDEHAARPRQPSHGFMSISMPMPMPTMSVAPEAVIHHAQNTLLSYGSQSADHVQASLTETTTMLIDHTIESLNDTIAVPLQDCIAQHAAAIKGIAQREEHVFRTVDKTCTAYATERARIVAELESLLAVLQRETAGAGEQDKVVDVIASDYTARVDQLANAATVAAHGRLASFLAKR